MNSTPDECINQRVVEHGKDPDLVEKITLSFAPGIIAHNTSIGDNVVIENASVENSIIMDGATISCQQTIQDSLIGRNVEISKNDEQQKQRLRYYWVINPKYN